MEIKLEGITKSYGGMMVLLRRSLQRWQGLGEGDGVQSCQGRR